MSKVYVGQHVTLTLDANITLSAATTLELRYFKPDEDTEVTGLTASASGTNASADLTPTILDTAGIYRFYVYAVIASKILIGATYKLEVFEVGL